jgi:hypothetical protein
MEDKELIERFENCTLDGAHFHHRDHVKVAWIYLRGNSVLEALGRFAAGLQRFATANGKANRYHETITWAFVFLIHERMERNGYIANWPSFVEANPDLFDWKNNILKSYYQDETLSSERARRMFVLPDRFGPHEGSELS